ncbi:hypothetical protein [Pontimicrobium aquaticum]|uniref:Transmembrane protein n=1 Tax=Pontimicrobium aquaticum TaxID=2565367 RepID=A0A4U0F0V4_9FLAO|nr:hypothetical protein [Pontimicrobium aquaticum]TJY37364.1 hypothetical protein E5167_05300 [Pontimicrobium aquaticum]
MKKETNIIQKSKIKRALHLAKTPILIALVLTPVRFSLELIGVPENAIYIVGLLWLTLGFAIYWGIKLYNDKNSLLILFLSLGIFSPISRFPVAVLWWIDTKWDIGTHYSLYFDNFAQATFQQVVYGSLIQLIPGFLLGAITIAIMRQKKTVTKQ